MARVVWSQRALEDLREIRRYVSRQSSARGQALATRLVRSTRQLEAFPLSGRVVPEDPTGTLRELIVGNYRVIYDVPGADVIGILMIVHGARLLDDLPDL